MTFWSGSRRRRTGHTLTRGWADSRSDTEHLPAQGRHSPARGQQRDKGPGAGRGGGGRGRKCGREGRGKFPRRGSGQIGATRVPVRPPPVLPRCSQLSARQARGPQGRAASAGPRAPPRRPLPAPECAQRACPGRGAQPTRDGAESGPPACAPGSTGVVCAAGAGAAKSRRG